MGHHSHVRELPGQAGCCSKNPGPLRRGSVHSSAFPLLLLERPQNGSIILYNRKKVKYRKDGYCWKKRKDGKTTREDHMKLKVKGVEVGGLTGQDGMGGGRAGGPQTRGGTQLPALGQTR